LGEEKNDSSTTTSSPQISNMGDLTDTQADMVSENYSYTFHPKDAISTSFDAAKLTGGAGLLVAAVQNTLLRENIGAFGVFTRFGSTVALFGG
jgi:hypothetical protein